MIPKSKKSYGNWKLTGKTIGEGGQGQVHLVKDNTQSRGENFALKELLNKSRIDRFKDEVRASFDLKHPNIVNIQDYDFDNNPPFIVMDYYESGSLEKLNLDNISKEKKFFIFKKICEAMVVAHGNSPTVIHRDLKPANIFLKNDLEPVVGDFGLVFFDDDGDRVTLTDEGVGSRYYMAPELEDGILDDISPASDVYALGKIFYWLMTGKIFAREKHRDSKYDILGDNSSTDSYLINEFLDKMIIATPNDRLKDAHSVLEEFEILIRRINMGANCIGPGIPLKCIFCGLGDYKLLSKRTPYGASTYDYYFKFINDDNWTILQCENCNNIQIFRPFHEGSTNKWIK